MNAKTLKALKGSIAYWRRIAAGEEGEGGSNQDPLCKEFWDYGRCTNCPIAAKGFLLCVGTPNAEWGGHHFMNHREGYFDKLGRFVRCDTCKDLALKAVRFRLSLLPKTKKARK
jgi:hypothetical protein